jgi:TonB family protein
MKETYRERRTFALVETTARDLRYAARTLRKSPGFTLTAVAVLALAIGANTAMFSVLNAVLLRPLPYQSPEQLAMLWTQDLTQNLREGRSALWDVEQWRSQTQSFADMATFDSVGRTLTAAEGAEQIPAVSISPNLLPLLGVQPAHGRGFSIQEAEQSQRLVLISHRLWQARFEGSRDTLGQPKPEPAQPQAAPPAAGVEERRGSPRGSPLGTSTLGAAVAGIDNPAFTYDYYLDRMLGLIEAQWLRPPVDQPIEAVVHFRIGHDGRISELEVIQESGLAAFDLAALRAVQNAAPFPPLPASYRSDSLGVNLIVR